jgi:hypothetical protein
MNKLKKLEDRKKSEENQRKTLKDRITQVPQN